LKSQIANFICPSDSVVTKENKRRPGVTTSAGATTAGTQTPNIIQLAVGNYVGMASSRECYGGTQNTFPASGETISIPPDGSFCSQKPTKLRDFRDGQSNVVMFSERVYDSIRKARELAAYPTGIKPTGAATMYATRGLGNSLVNGSVGPNASAAFGHPDALAGAWGGINKLDTRAGFLYRKFIGVSSRHSGGVNTARGDGSVHFIQDNITLARDNMGTVTILTDDVDGDDLAFFQQTLVQGEIWRQLVALNDGATLVDPNN
jgi:prepilin-type processing-associated H-X9-DG protein